MENTSMTEELLKDLQEMRRRYRKTKLENERLWNVAQGHADCQCAKKISTRSK